MSQYIEYLKEWLSPLGTITARAMFGGHCLYCDGVVFGLVAGQELYLKADGGNRPAFEAIGARAFQPFRERPEVMQYYAPPAAFFDNADVMAEWAAPAIEAGRRARAKKKR